MGLSIFCLNFADAYKALWGTCSCMQGFRNLVSFIFELWVFQYKKVTCSARWPPVGGCKQNLQFIGFIINCLTVRIRRTNQLFGFVKCCVESSEVIFPLKKSALISKTSGWSMAWCKTCVQHLQASTLRTVLLRLMSRDFYCWFYLAPGWRRRNYAVGFSQFI